MPQLPEHKLKIGDSNAMPLRHWGTSNHTLTPVLHHTRDTQERLVWASPTDMSQKLYSDLGDLLCELNPRAVCPYDKREERFGLVV
ncbi:hypothetical protein ElyMa_004929400 [Elysia marginata]|uniref:Uncharacterized protein n=1 Tax=Elysia marginata TaxID=1093978 RepID=A0AAV4J1H8_9GAST|nr:hypothetical protein ElyMa_004929400 [Elysia marginata]